MPRALGICTSERPRRLEDDVGQLVGGILAVRGLAADGDGFVVREPLGARGAAAGDICD